MRPTLRQMQYIVAVADTGTISRAAEKENVSQPSLSAQLKDMEDILGVSLLERSRKGAQFTPFGRIFVDRARIILSDVQSLKSLAKDIEGNLTGNVKLGTLPTVGPYLLPQATHRLHQTFPQLKLEVREESTVDLNKDLISGVLDVIISTPEDHPRTKSFPIVRENLYICVAADDPLAYTKSNVYLDELEGRELMTLGYGHKFTVVVQNLAATAGAITRNAYEGTSLDAIRQMAYMGVGVGVLPSLYAISEAKRDKDLILRRIDHPLAQRQISVIWRNTSPLEEKFKTMGTHFAETAADIMR